MTKNKKGQALVEALAGLLVTVMFFTSCLKLWITAAEELKTEQKERQQQLCELSKNKRCQKDGGFILVTMLMQLMVLLFATQALVAIFLNEEFNWKVTNWCFDNALAAVTGGTAAKSSLSDIEGNFNSAAPHLIRIRTNTQGPFKIEDAAIDPS